MNPRSEKILPLTALVLGALILAGGVVLARRWLPEWYGDFPERSFFIQRYQELARQVGFRPGREEPRAVLAMGTGNDSEGLNEEELDKLEPSRAFAIGAGGHVRVRRNGFLPGDRRTFHLSLYFSPRGVVQSLVLDSADSGQAAGKARTGLPPKQREAFARLLLAPGETLGAPREETPGETERLYALTGSDPLSHLRVDFGRNGSVNASRRLGALKPAEGGEDSEFPLAAFLLIGVPVILGVLTVLGMFLALLGRRRIDLVNGAAFGALSLLGTLPAFFTDPSRESAVENFLPGLFVSLWLFMLWSVGESYLRSVQPGLAANLDSLRAGRLGPRGGRAILYGLSAGAALAGLRLGLLAAAAARPGIWPDSLSLEFPLFGPQNPFWFAFQTAGAVALALALALRFLPARWALLGGCLAAGLAIFLVEMRPLWVHVAANFVLVPPLVVLCRRKGLAATLSATLALFLLPAAVYAGLRLEWLPAAFTVATSSSAILLGLGLVSLMRPAHSETERLKPPAFMRRLEDERRLQYEMDLLARMQLGLLPANLPQIPGWEIAARSLLATEAGGDLYDALEDEDGNLWIAAGDVAGHGYSCAIAQAMTVAALTSLIQADQTPSQVLRGVDRVIRRSGAHRHFTSLALVRLNLRTGEGLMSNAGHPFPLLLAVGGEVQEINLPGLPLGRGPQRQYENLPFEIPPGGALVFCSDGLFEATNAREDAYGYDRPRELLRSRDSRNAEQILETLFQDWRRYMGTNEPPSDDTTVVVIRRL